QHLTDKKEEKPHQPFQIPANIQRSVPNLVITLNKLETEYSNTYLKE
ncbi:1667_t:CDS:1, partial [Acaulospora colombiana]